MSEKSFQQPSPLSSNDSLIIAIFFAAIMHVFLILSINFNTSKANKASKSLAITLVTQTAKKAPKKAEFLAQNNQIGTGVKKDTPTPSVQKRPSNADKRKQVPRKKIVTRQTQVRKQVLTQKIAQQKIQQVEKINKKTEKHHPKLSMDVLRRQVSELGAKIRYQPPSSHQKRIKFVNSVNAHKYAASQYITDWQRKIEGMGNLNYPAIAKRPGFSRRLTMDVGIKPDGTIYSLRIRRSSGYPALDQAAKRIVELSAPFPPLPKELLQELDVLVITRVWNFSDKTGLRTR